LTGHFGILGKHGVTRTPAMRTFPPAAHKKAVCRPELMPNCRQPAQDRPHCWPQNGASPSRSRKFRTPW